MTVIRAARYTREEIRANPQRTYLFGDNELRQGLGGQAREARGEPNTVGIRTKRTPAMTPGAFWHEEDRIRCIEMVDEDFAQAYEAMAQGQTLVIPQDGIGTGRAELQTRAPSVLGRIEQWIAVLSDREAIQELSQPEEESDPIDDVVRRTEP